jgi:Variant SH3 domain/PX domain
MSRKRQPPVLTQRGSSTPKAIFNLPPKKIIKATKSYKASKPGELSFQTGDFFYVIHDKPQEQVYEVINPVEKKRGLVKYKYFANVAKNANETGARSRGGQEKEKERKDMYDDYAASEYYEDEYFRDDRDARYDDRDDRYDDSRYYDRDDRYDDRDYASHREDKSRGKKQEPFSKNLQSTTPKKSSTTLDSCLVSSCTVQKDRWYFIIHAKYSSGQMDILKRSYDDIWALQVTLLSRFPSESGRNNQSRLIPFLQPPEKGIKMNQQSQTKQDLNRYFRDLLFLPPSILQSTYFLKFFNAKVGDLKNTSLSTDVGDTLLDLLDDIEDSPMISCKVVLGDEVISWVEEPGLDFDELMFQVEDRLGFQIERLLYLDEIDNMTELYGDEDLRLLISFSPSLRLFVK